MALTRFGAKWDRWIIMVGWWTPTVTLFAFYRSNIPPWAAAFVFYAMVMTLSTNILVMWESVVIAENEHLEKLKLIAEQNEASQFCANCGEKDGEEEKCCQHCLHLPKSVNPDAYAHFLKTKLKQNRDEVVEIINEDAAEEDVFPLGAIITQMEGS